MERHGRKVSPSYDYTQKKTLRDVAHLAFNRTD